MTHAALLNNLPKPVRTYMDIVFDSQQWTSLHHILAPDLCFEGPLYRFDSAEAYIASMASDPPHGFGYELLQTFEKERSMCLIYRFSKPGVSTLMAQTFELNQGLITHIMLVFDTRAFDVK